MLSDFGDYFKWHAVATYENIWSHCFFSTLGMKVLQQEPQFENSGQSYNHFTIVNYDSSVVIWGIFKSGTTLEA